MSPKQPNLSLELVAILLPERSGWLALFPDLPGCATQGYTVEGALAMAADAAASHVAVMRETGAAPPNPRAAAVRADRGWAAENGVNWETAILRSVPVEA